MTDGTGKSEDGISWPEPPSGPTQQADASALYAAKLAVEEKRVDEEIATSAAREAAQTASLAALQDALTTLSAASIDRAHAAADTVQKSAAAIAVLYTGVLGLVFSVDKDPLPVRGILVPAFLGLAVVLSTGYVAYLSPPLHTIPEPHESDNLQVAMLRRVNFVTDVSDGMVKPKSWMMRSSVAALGFGLAYLPLAFVSVPHLTTAAHQVVVVTPTTTTTAPRPPWNRPPSIRHRQQSAPAEPAQPVTTTATTPAKDGWFTLGLAAFGLLVTFCLPPAIQWWLKRKDKKKDKQRKRASVPTAA